MPAAAQMVISTIIARLPQNGLVGSLSMASLPNSLAVKLNRPLAKEDNVRLVLCDAGSPPQAEQQQRLLRTHMPCVESALALCIKAA